MLHWPPFDRSTGCLPRYSDMPAQLGHLKTDCSFGHERTGECKCDWDWDSDWVGLGACPGMVTCLHISATTSVTVGLGMIGKGEYECDCLRHYAWDWD